MGEIKSTLDLIMEKTKNLTMSSEEKEEIQRQEWLKKARGWIQKFLDGQLEGEKLRIVFSDRTKPSSWEKMLKRELIAGLDPEGDNLKRFELMTILLQISPEPFLEVLEDYNRQVGHERTRQGEGQIIELANQGFSGPAVIPNLDRNPAWKDFLAHEKEACKERWRGFIDS